MTAPMLRIWESFAVQKEDLASLLPPWKMFLHLPGTSQANQDRETHHHCHSQCLLQLRLQLQVQSEAMRLPSIATQLHPVAISRHMKMATRSNCCDGIEVVTGQMSM